MHGVPEDFARVVAAVKRGETPRVKVRDLVQWFGFDHRGTKVNRYIRSVMEQEGVMCTPALEAPRPEEPLTFSSIAPIVVQVVAPTAAAGTRELPHPVAWFESKIAAQTDLTRRVTTRLNALERIVSYVVFATLASVVHDGEEGRKALREALRGVLRDDGDTGPPISFGTWVSIARDLAVLKRGGDDAIGDVARALVSSRTRGPTLIHRLSNEIVPLRNASAHGSNPNARWLQETESTLDSFRRDFLEALRPLFDCDLVCVRETHVGTRESYRYDLRVLHGDGHFFPSRTLETSFRLVSGWAHLLLPDGTPLRLAPGILCVEDRGNEELHLFCARTLALEPRQKVRLQSLKGMEERTERMPESS